MSSAVLIASPIGVPPIGCSVGGSNSVAVTNSTSRVTRPPNVTIATSTRFDASGSASKLLLVGLQTLVELVDPRTLHRRRRIDDQHAGHPRLGILGKFDCSKRIFRGNLFHSSREMAPRKQRKRANEK